jgi:hypothetical protein
LVIKIDGGFTHYQNQIIYDQSVSIDESSTFGGPGNYNDGSALDLYSTAWGPIVKQSPFDPTQTAMFGYPGDIQITGGSAYMKVESVTSNLNGDGDTDWIRLGVGAPGGNDTQVQYNDGGTLSGMTTLTFNDSTNQLKYTYGTPGDGKVLTSDADGDISWATPSSGGISNVVEDTTPQLGGTLDANGNVIDMGSNNITDTKVGQWDTAYGWGDHSTRTIADVFAASTTEASRTASNGRYLHIDGIQARDTGGLFLLESTNSKGIFIENNTGQIGIRGNGIPTAMLEIGVPDTDEISFKLNRASGQPSIKSTNSWLIMDNLHNIGGATALNYYSQDNVILCKGGGKVGIGTVNPDDKLHITGGDIFVDGDSSSVWIGGNGDNDAPRLRLHSATNGAYIDWEGSSSGSLNFRSDTTTKVVIDSSGKVGIGTTSPTSTISINGSVSAKYNWEGSNYTATESDYFIVMSHGISGRNVTLPDASTCAERIYVIKRGGAGGVSIVASSSDSIDGATSHINLSSQYNVVTVQSDGGNVWFITSCCGSYTSHNSGAPQGDDEA